MILDEEDYWAVNYRVSCQRVALLAFIISIEGQGRVEVAETLERFEYKGVWRVEEMLGWRTVRSRNFGVMVRNVTYTGST